MKPVQCKAYTFAEVLEEAKRKADTRETKLSKLSPEARQKLEEKEAANLQAALDEYYKTGGGSLIHLKL
jgi:hypothetical protein